METKEKQLKIDLKIKGSNRVFNLRCANVVQYLDWIKRLTHAIVASNGVIKKLQLSDYKNDVSKYFDFWRFLRIDEDGFKDLAEVGDLILCKSKKSPKQQVDQIGMVINLFSEDKPDETEIYIFRTGTDNKNSQRGMILETWDDFRIYKNQNL